MNNFRNDKGITLIALVITIIVLLILAGVSISTIAGENGVLTKARLAKEETHVGSDQESVDLAVAEYEMKKYSGESTDLVSFLAEYNDDWTIEEKDGVVSITVNSCGHTYTTDLDTIVTEDNTEVDNEQGTEETPETDGSDNTTPLYLWEVVENGDYVDYYGTDDIEEYSWVVLDVDKDAQLVKLIRVVCWYDQMTETPTTIDEHNAMANEVVRENNKYYNPDLVESADKVTALTVEEVKKNNNGDFEWMGEIVNSYMVVNQTCALVGATEYDNNVYAIMSNGQIGYYEFGTHYVRAVVELKSNLIVTDGTGVSGDGYQISVQE